MKICYTLFQNFVNNQQFKKNIFKFEFKNKTFSVKPPKRNFTGERKQNLQIIDL